MDPHAENIYVPRPTAYDVFHAQTETIINVCEFIVMCLLPFLWFLDFKNIISLLYKEISLPNNKEKTEPMIFCPNAQLLFITVGIGAYLIHRRWRLQMYFERADILQQEAPLTDTKELQMLRQKVLAKIDDIIEAEKSTPLEANKEESAECA